MLCELLCESKEIVEIGVNSRRLARKAAREDEKCRSDFFVAAQALDEGGGRPKALTEKQIRMLRNLAADPHNSVEDICKQMEIGRTTYYRYIGAEEKN